MTVIRSSESTILPGQRQRWGELSKELAAIVGNHGVALRHAQLMYGGAPSTVVSTSLADDWETLAARTEAITADADFQAFMGRSGADPASDIVRVGVLEDLNGNGVFDEDDLLAASVFSTFDKMVGSFEHDGVQYEVSLTGFWELDENGAPILTGEGWSPEDEFTHFEVRAEVNVAGKRPAEAGTTVPSSASCQRSG